MKAYVLAAGYATRLHPLTLDRAKPLLEVAGAPILDHIARSLLELDDLETIVVISNHRFHRDFEAWAEAFRATHVADRGVGLRVLDDGTTSDDDKLGAIGDLAFALHEVPPQGRDVMVIAGDNLVDLDLRSVQREFRTRRRPTLVVRDVPIRREPTRYNEVTLDAADRVTRFREKPPEALTGLAAIALYFFPPDVERWLRDYLAEGGNPDAPGHFIAWLVERVDVGATHSRGEWYDIGSFETLAHARETYRGRA